MATRFDDWEGDYLEHHGIKGMRWGVRRYQNEDGTLTEAGKSRYGAGPGEGGVKTSARKMQRDFNKLDQGYANVAAERAAATKAGNKHVFKYMKRGVDLARKGYTPEMIKGDKKRTKEFNKIQKAEEKYQKADKQMKEIENLQWRILAQASQNGYTTSSKPVIRLGNTGKQRTAAIFAAAALGGGAISGALIGGIRGATALKVKGQKVKIRKNGSGSSNIVTYPRNNENENREHRGRSRQARRNA